SAVSVHALEGRDQKPGQKQRGWRFGKKRLNQPRRGESSFLSFQNSTPYDVTVYASVRKKGERKYGRLVELGSVSATGTSNNFAGLNNAFIGRGNTKYWVKV